MDRVKETISNIMCRDTELFVFLLLNDLNKCIKAHVVKQGAEAIPLKTPLPTGIAGEVKLSVMMEV